MASKPPTVAIKKESSPTDEAWDEQRLKESLEHLKLLHIQVRIHCLKPDNPSSTTLTSLPAPGTSCDHSSHARAATHQAPDR